MVNRSKATEVAICNPQRLFDDMFTPSWDDAPQLDGLNEQDLCHPESTAFWTQSHFKIVPRLRFPQSTMRMSPCGWVVRWCVKRCVYQRVNSHACIDAASETSVPNPLPSYCSLEYVSRKKPIGFG